MRPGSIPGMNGRIEQVRILTDGDASLPTGPDLVEMARRALCYLHNNPDPAHGYQCRFNYFLLHCPPFDAAALNWMFDVTAAAERSGSLDPIAIGDTESRNDIAFSHMWAITGTRDGQNVQEAVHRRLESYIRSGPGRAGDDMCWAVPYALSSDVDAPCAMPWTTGKLLHSSADLYRLTGEEHYRRVARRLFEGLRRLASWNTGRAFYAHAWPGPRDDGKHVGGYRGHYPSIISPLLNYYRRCRDPEALDFAVAMAEGFLGDLQPEHLHQSDGRVLGHNHVQMHAVRGVAELGALTGEWRYLDWAKAAYDYYWSSAFDTGWLPEVLALPAHCNHSETCLTSDMLEMAVWFARAGQPHLWDRVERTLHNYLVPAQFVLTPAFEALWRLVNCDKTPDELQVGLAQLREVEGGFLSALAPNDRIFQVPSGMTHHGVTELPGRRIVMDMMGCCPPEGMRALYVTWANIVTMVGNDIRVNLAFNHDDPLAAVSTGMPQQGYLQVVPKVEHDFYLRPPSWTPRQQVRVWRRGRPVETIWGGPALDYVVLPRAGVGEALELRWPLVKFDQHVVRRHLEGGEKGQLVEAETYTYRWVGNTITHVEPSGQWLPLYHQTGDGS
jgi:hypothetical protein